METELLTDEELEQIRAVCDAAQRAGINWPLGVSLFRPENEEERRWKEKMLKTIELISGKR